MSALMLPVQHLCLHYQVVACFKIMLLPQIWCNEG